MFVLSGVSDGWWLVGNVSDGPVDVGSGWRGLSSILFLAVPGEQSVSTAPYVRVPSPDTGAQKDA
jgi:hypothetical protein